MKLRSLLAATTACALVAAAPAANAEDLYVSVFGGANWLNDDSGLTDSDDGWWHADTDTGFVLGGTIGTSLSRWAEGLALKWKHHIAATTSKESSPKPIGATTVL